MGASQEDANEVQRVLEGYGLQVESVSLIAHSMRVSGTAAQMEAAFHPGLGIYTSPDQGEFRGREGRLEISAEIAGIVTGVFGLDGCGVARRAAQGSAGVTLRLPTS